MRMDFNVLWVEDQQAAVAAQRERIERAIAQEGFRLQVRFVTTIAESAVFVADEIYRDHVDLILVDRNLGGGEKGEDAIAEFRKQVPYKDILFYSALSVGLSQIGANRQMQGVFYSTRDRLPDAVAGIFETLVKKVLDIDHARGIVMGATSEIDGSVNRCLLAIYNSSDQKGRTSMLQVVVRHAKEKRKDIEKALAKIEGSIKIEQLLEMHEIYTSNDRLRLLLQALKLRSSGEGQADILRRYIKDTVPKRNRLAHVHVLKDGFSRKLIDERTSKELSSEDMKNLRVELIEAQDFFDSLLRDFS